MKNKLRLNIIELLTVIGVIAILISVVFVVFSPRRRFIEARNMQRLSSVNSLLQALSNYKFDNNGADPALIADDTYYMIGTGTDAAGCLEHPTSAVLDLSLLQGLYLTAIPADPLSGTAARTMYYLVRSRNGKTIIGSCDPEKVDGSLPVISAER